MALEYDFSRRCVLDVGCGQGIISSIFVGESKSFLGIDVCEAAIDKCRHRFEGFTDVDFKASDIFELRTTDTFDVINLSFVLDYLGFRDHPKYFCRTILKLYNLLSKDGLLIIFNPVYIKEDISRLNAYEFIFIQYGFSLQKKQIINVGEFDIAFSLFLKNA